VPGPPEDKGRSQGGLRPGGLKATAGVNDAGMRWPPGIRLEGARQALMPPVFRFHRPAGRTLIDRT
jgi:hypothetical protein